LNVGAKFVSPWVKKVGIDWIFKHKFSLIFLFCFKMWAQSLWAKVGPKKP
jgi:hypothetical protein